MVKLFSIFSQGTIIFVQASFIILFFKMIPLNQSECLIFISWFSVNYYLLHFCQFQAISMTIVDCIEGVNCWLSGHFLELNRDKMEILVFGPNSKKQNKLYYLSSLSLKYSGKDSILGVILDNIINWLVFTTSIISKLRKFIYQTESVKRIHVFISNRYNYGDTFRIFQTVNRNTSTHLKCSRVQTFQFHLYILHCKKKNCLCLMSV